MKKRLIRQEDEVVILRGDDMFCATGQTGLVVRVARRAIGGERQMCADVQLHHPDADGGLIVVRIPRTLLALLPPPDPA